jgi:hypothetical protein
MIAAGVCDVARHKIEDFEAVFAAGKACPEDIGAIDVGLFDAVSADCFDAEKTAVFFVENAGKKRAGVEIRQTAPVEASVAPDNAAGFAVSADAVSILFIGSFDPLIVVMVLLAAGYVFNAGHCGELSRKSVTEV